MTTTVNNRIASAFSQGHKALMPYYTLGFPDYPTSLAVIKACAAAGADLIELGIPFSDPLADGPTIQHSSQVALKAGMSVKRCLQAVKDLRTSGVQIPLILMGYINPLLSYGLEEFTAHAAKVGVDGFIIPDLPPEESAEMDALCRQHNLSLIYLLAPNSSQDRIQLVCQRSRGFTYLVSVSGVTGTRSELPPDLSAFIQRVRPYAQTPLAVGFGISTPTQARQVGAVADGIIVGSALIKAVSSADPAQAENAAFAFIQSLRQGLG